MGAVGFLVSSIFSVIYSLAFEQEPARMNEISGLMITAVAGGGVVTPVIGYAIDRSGVTGGLVVILLCLLYLVFCAFAVGRGTHTASGGRALLTLLLGERRSCRPKRPAASRSMRPGGLCVAAQVQRSAESVRVTSPDPPSRFSIPSRVSTPSTLPSGV